MNSIIHQNLSPNSKRSLTESPQKNIRNILDCFVWFFHIYHRDINYFIFLHVPKNKERKATGLLSRNCGLVGLKEEQQTDSRNHRHAACTYEYKLVLIL